MVEAHFCAEVKAVPPSGASVNCTAGEGRREGPCNRWVSQPEDQKQSPGQLVFGKATYRRNAAEGKLEFSPVIGTVFSETS